MVPTDYHAVFPKVNGYIVRPLLVNPPMCYLKELQDGTYGIEDLELMHQMLDIKDHMKPKPKDN